MRWFVADRGRVVDQRVVPHVRDVLRVPGDRHAPRDRRAADREVLQPLTDDAERLVALAVGLHEVRMGVVPVEQALLVTAELEEVVLLLDELDRSVVDGAVPVHQVALGVVGLAGNAVEPLVRAELDVAVVVDLLQPLLRRDVVARLGGADEVVVGDAELGPRALEALARLVGHLLGRKAALLGRPLDLQAVLVGAGEEVGVVTVESVPTGQRVGDDGRVRVPDVRRVVDVVDRRGDVEAAHRRRLPAGGEVVDPLFRHAETSGHTGRGVAG